MPTNQGTPCVADDGLSLPTRMLCAGLAGCTADVLTFPFDTIKVWLQVRKDATETSGSGSGNGGKATPSGGGGTAPKRFSSMGKPRPGTTGGLVRRDGLSVPVRANATVLLPSVTTSLGGGQVTTGSQSGVVRTIWRNVKTNGVTSLYGGLTAGLQRQIAFSSVRIGIYGNVKEFFCDLFGSTHQDVPIRIAAGTTTAMVAVAMFQPTEVVKIRMQAQARGAKGNYQYPNTLHAYRHLWSLGVKEAWRGVGANATRLAVVNVSELVTYDVVKEQLLDRDIMKDTPGCHFVSACVAGFVTTIFASPVDVVKTRYMNSPKGLYSGPFDCLRATVRNNGFHALYRGFIPAYLRLGSWNIMMFLTYEQYKRIARPSTDL